MIANEFLDSPDPSPTLIYAVVAIDGGSVQYAGPNLWRAALAWMPGTCHGQAANAKDAVIWARSMAHFMRETEKKLGVRGKVT